MVVRGKGTGLRFNAVGILRFGGRAVCAVDFDRVRSARIEPEEVVRGAERIRMTSGCKGGPLRTKAEFRRAGGARKGLALLEQCPGRAAFDAAGDAFFVSFP